MQKLAAFTVGVLLLAPACGGDEVGAKGGGGAGDAAGTGGSAAGGDEVSGCDGARLLKVPVDPGVAGPWTVGVRTVNVAITGGSMPVEVWYPAEPGSEEGAEAAVYDVREWLPAGERAKVSDAKHGPPQGDGGFRDLPIDAAHGPYPVVIHIHGTAAFRAASGGQGLHWASRGFVVVAADHPGMMLGDMLASVSGGTCTGQGIPQDLNRDVDAMIASLGAPTGALAFLAGRIDMDRIGIAGHSQGAGAAAAMSNKPNVQVVMPLATSAAVAPSSTLKSSLILAGMQDTIIPYATDVTAYGGTPSPKRLVGIDQAGHLVMTNLCGLRNPEGQDLVAVGQEVGICGMNLASFLWDCSASYVSQERGEAAVNAPTAAVLEETLHCADRSASFALLEANYPEIADFDEDL